MNPLSILLLVVTSTLRMAVSYILASTGGAFSVRAGVSDLGIEGMMITGAFFGVLGTHLTQNVWIGALFGIFECIAKIIKRRHTLLVCVSVILSNLANIALSAYLLTRPVILSTEFTTYIKTQKWGNMDILRFMGNPVAWPLPMILLAIIVICSLINCITAIVRTVRTS